MMDALCILSNLLCHFLLAILDGRADRDLAMAFLVITIV